MRRLRLLHIGDIHYPERYNERLEDVKDKALPSEVVEQMVQIPLQAVVRQAARELEADPVNGYLVSGDLTSKGSLKAYEECLDFLLKAFTLKAVPQDRIHAVPGNHDFDRSLVDPVDPSKKFDQISAAWKSRGIPVLAVKGVRHTTIKLGSAAAAIYSLNSCLGCGEKRHLPNGVANELEAAISGYTSRVGLSKAFELVGEQLDSPGFVQQEINDVFDSARKLESQVVPLVLSHHNLLPQALPRLEIYTEVMNAGRVRSAFTNVERTVLYCHGHIHDDVVELVEIPGSNGSRMAAIAAPELARGFNIIQLEYGEKGTALGCKVLRFSYDWRSGQVTPRELRIPLNRLPYQRAISAGHAALKTILSKLKNEEYRFQAAFEKTKWPDDTNNRKRFADALEEACWLGLVEISNSEREPDAWWITKTAR